MKHDPAAWRRLSELIRSQRGRLGWTQAELAQRAGVSTKSVATAESGNPPTRTPPTLNRVARALGWADGSIDAVLAGGEPITVTASGPAPAPSQGRAISALRGAMEFSWVCAEMGADAATLAQFDAAAEALLSAAVTAQARTAGLTQEHFAAVAHSPRGDGGPASDRDIVDEAVRLFDAERGAPGED